MTTTEIEAAYNGWDESKHYRSPEPPDTVESFVRYVIGDGWKHNANPHRHSMGCGDGRDCLYVAMVAVKAVHFWQQKREAQQASASEEKR